MTSHCIVLRVHTMYGWQPTPQQISQGGRRGVLTLVHVPEENHCAVNRESGAGHAPAAPIEVVGSAGVTVASLAVTVKAFPWVGAARAAPTAGLYPHGAGSGPVTTAAANCPCTLHGANETSFHKAQSSAVIHTSQQATPDYCLSVVRVRFVFVIFPGGRPRLPSVKCSHPTPICL